VQSILAMAEHLGLRVVAEGIETAQQADYLSGNGSPLMQGYLFSRPAPLDDLLAALDGLASARSAA
jgi:EAL domain-containing protein (putative c-di-GMP-specific phosphodiesterase class I)